jgi:hypothetical protein
MIILVPRPDSTKDLQYKDAFSPQGILSVTAMGAPAAGPKAPRPAGEYLSGHDPHGWL